jgi:ribosomal protein S27AE
MEKIKGSQTTKVCPKCGSCDIIIIPGSVNTFGAGDNIPTGLTIIGGLIAVKVTRYLCGGCGFIEEWIDDAEDRERIKKKYGKSES